ncbi:MAG: dolichol-phosphate mannosyltransferase [Lysobacterales bacterium]|jgi:dolichol-phosphate mannosyltransferase
MKKILVSPIAYNEHVKLKCVIERFLASSVRSRVDYVVMDDGSDDGTKELLETYAGKGVSAIHHDKRQGVGAAIRTMIQYARYNSYDMIVIMAGNDKDNPDEIPRLIDPIIQKNYDFIQGSRYLAKNCVGGDMPLYRKLATRVHPFLMQLITSKRVTDTTNGFRAFKLSVFDNPHINIMQNWLDQYELEPYILYKALKLDYVFKEVPVTKIYPAKSLGYTKMKPITGWWSILRPLVYLGLRIKK